MHPSDKSQTPEAIFKHDLYTYLRGLDKVDEHLPDAPDIEGKWYDIANAYMPDAVREFNQYPTVVFGWMMYVGMAVAKYWDEDWELYNKVENLYTYLRDRIDFDLVAPSIHHTRIGRCLPGRDCSTAPTVSDGCRHATEVHGLSHDKNRMTAWAHPPTPALC